jgi:hypothetical protein
MRADHGPGDDGGPASRYHGEKSSTAAIDLRGDCQSDGNANRQTNYHADRTVTVAWRFVQDRGRELNTVADLGLSEFVGTYRQLNGAPPEPYGENAARHLRIPARASFLPKDFPLDPQ